MLHERRWWAVMAMGLSIFLVTVDTTIVALALPSLAQHFHLSNSTASAVTLSYSIPMTLLIVPIGIVINRFRPLTAFLVSVTGFGTGSALCGLAHAFWMVLLGRVIQGLFGAVIVTQGFAVAAAVVLPSERGRAMGTIGALAPLGAVIGPGIGGLLVSQWGWPTIFFVNIPFCFLAAVLALFSLRGLSLGERGAGNGWQQMGGLLGRPPFAWALLLLLCAATIDGALYYLLPFDLSIVQHFASSTAGAVLLCMPLGMAAMGPVGGWLSDRYGGKVFRLGGLALLLVGLIALTSAVGSSTSTLALVWRLLLVGIGLGLFSGPNQTLLMSVGSRETMGAASALAGLGINVGFVCGPLVVSMTWLVLVDPVTQMVGGMILLGILSTLTLIVAWCATRTGRSPSPTVQRASSLEEARNEGIKTSLRKNVILQDKSKRIG